MQYDNTPTVVVVLAPTPSGELITVRRNNEPGKGLLGLPGGYHMRGETWQQAGVRELFEETGYMAHPGQLQLVSMETDEYGNNLVIAKVRGAVFGAQDADHEEVQEIVLLRGIPWPDRVAFPRHFYAIRKRYLGLL